MGCFSFLCKESGKAALSTSFDGSPVFMFLLKKGKVIEKMYGNYDSYGRVFEVVGVSSFEWKLEWGDVCDLMFSKDKSDGIALILASEFTGEIPTTRSEDDPNQGWGGDDGEEDLMGSVEGDLFPVIPNPYHKVYETNEGETK